MEGPGEEEEQRQREFEAAIAELRAARFNMDKARSRAAGYEQRGQGHTDAGTQAEQDDQNAGQRLDAAYDNLEDNFSAEFELWKSSAGSSYPDDTQPE